MDARDYYVLLGVKRTATSGEIRRAYRKLARKYHPELNPGDRAAEVRYRRIFEAYEILSSPEGRDRYDRQGTEPAPEAESFEPSYGFEGFDFGAKGPAADIFPEIFSRQPRVRREQGELVGEDLAHTLSMAFEESLRGLETSFQISRLIACEGCLGWGRVATGNPESCPACGGSGRSTQARGHMLFARPCPECAGAGTVDRQVCPACHGAGRKAREETVRVRIPPGVDEGSKVRVAGKGNEGRGGGPPGDLYIQIHVSPHPLFTRKGDNLFITVPVTFTEAALGFRIEVPTLDGPVSLRIRAGTQCGQKLKLSGRGVPSLRGGARGDLFVTVRVLTPMVHDERSQEILRELARLHPEKPREDPWTSAQPVGGDEW